MPNSNSFPIRPRLHALDGLRGVAAVIVVLWHCNVVFGLPQYFLNLQNVIPGFHFLWAGTSSVGLFFVLSGYVLYLAYQHSALKRPGNYLLARFLRIYPVFWFVLALNFFCRWFQETYFSNEIRLMPLYWLEPLSLKYFLEQFSLIIPTEKPHLIFADWSLEWEVRFSLLLPFYLLLVKKYPRAFLSVVFLISYSLKLKAFFLHFALGIFLAQSSLLKNRIPTSIIGRFLWAYLFVFLFAFRYTPSLNLPRIPNSEIYWYINAIGSAGIILLALEWPAFRKILSTPFFQFLGKISFSLYLIHYAVLINIIPFIRNLSSSYFSDSNTQKILLTVAALFLSILLASLIYQSIEKPFIQLGKWLLQFKNDLKPQVLSDLKHTK